MPERHHVIVIGAGQAGLAVGSQLVEAGVDVVVLDGAARVGDSWRNRWDSLKLFTAAEFAGLPGLPFPGDPNAFPSKDQMADYLEEYVRRAQVPVRLGTRVTALDREGDRYVITTDGAHFEADQVVVSTGAYQAGRVPAWAPELDRSIVQMHSSAYRNPTQIRPGGVLVVGAGNTGAELALEAARAGHDVWLSGRDVGQVPRFLRLANARPFFFLATHLLTNETPIGRKLARLMRAGHSSPLVRIRSKEIRAAGIRRVGRVTGSRGGQPVLDDGRVLDVATVLWCNGFRLDFSWINLPIFDADGYPRHERGRVPSYPGLYFAGLPFQRNLASSTLVGANRDSAFVVGWIVERLGLSATVGRQTMAPVRA